MKYILIIIGLIAMNGCSSEKAKNTTNQFDWKRESLDINKTQKIETEEKIKINQFDWKR